MLSGKPQGGSPFSPITSSIHGRERCELAFGSAVSSSSSSATHSPPPLRDALARGLSVAPPTAPRVLSVVAGPLTRRWTSTDGGRGCQREQGRGCAICRVQRGQWQPRAPGGRARRFPALEWSWESSSWTQVQNGLQTRPVPNILDTISCSPFYVKGVSLGHVGRN